MSEILSRYFGRLDKTMAAIGAGIGIAAICWLIYRAPDYVSTGVMLTVACVIYLLLANRGLTSLKTDVLSISAPRLAIVLNILFLILVSYSFIVLYNSSDARPLGYFIATVLMSMILALEILIIPEGAKGRSVSILVKILILGLSLRWSLFYVYPESYFGTDPWRNALLYELISETGHFSTALRGYYYLPLHHIFVAITSHFTGLAIREAMIFSVGLFEVISFTFIFLSARYAFGTKIALIATLLLCINNLHIYFGWWLVAQTMGISLVAAMLFLLYNPRTQGNIIYRVFIILVLATLLFTHTLSPFVALIILLLSYLGSLAYASLTKTKVLYKFGSVTTLFGVAILSYWIYVTYFFNNFLLMFIGKEESGHIVLDTAVTTFAITGNQLWSEINKLGILIFYGLAVIGILYVSNLKLHKNNPTGFNLAFCGLFMATIIFSITFLFRVGVAISRWFVFLDSVLVVPAALGLVILSDSVVTKWKKISLFASISLILTFFMITNMSASFDSPIYPDSMKGRSALKQSELCAAETLKSICPEPHIMDFMHALAHTGTPEFQVKMYFLRKESVLTSVREEGLFILRKYIVDKLFVKAQEDGINSSASKQDPYLEIQKYGYNQVYDAGTVAAFHR